MCHPLPGRPYPVYTLARVSLEMTSCFQVKEVTTVGWEHSHPLGKGGARQALHLASLSWEALSAQCPEQASPPAPITALIIPYVNCLDTGLSLPSDCDLRGQGWVCLCLDQSVCPESGPQHPAGSQQTFLQQPGWVLTQKSPPSKFYILAKMLHCVVPSSQSRGLHSPFFKFIQF